tara:strand:+ start:73542 stop:73724 length:183 start_codon:yes stop_codon:yes gene_type:complete
MPFYKVIKTMQYEEEVSVEASSPKEAEELSGMECDQEFDHVWYNSEAEEITATEYEERYE